MKRFHLLPARLSVFRCALILAATAAGGQAAVLLNDTFSDNERATQNLTGSAEWGIAPNGANANISSTINGITLSGADAGGSAGFAFDEIVIFTSSGTVPVGQTVTFDNVTVTVIPEPAAAMLGGHGLLALLRRRRRV